MKPISNKLLFLFTLTFVLSFSYSFATGRILGKVVDSETGTALAGAKIKDLTNKKVSYTNRYGIFYLPNSGNAVLQISSIGYEIKKIETNGQDSFNIKLKSLPNLQKEAIVTGEFNVNQIVAQAIEKKTENQAKIKTFAGMLYSKMNLELDGSLINSASASGGNGSISIGATLSPGSKQNDNDRYKYFFLETFSNVAQDPAKGINQAEIIQRRQTANMPMSSNVLAISKFINFYDDEIKIVDAQITSPLASNAFSYYEFKLLNRSKLNDKLVYEISVQPSTSTYPAFEGTIKLVEGSFSIIEANLKPSKSTAMQFIESIEYIEKFDENDDGIWYPSLLEIKAKASANLLSGVADIDIVVNTTSIYSNVEINKLLPDSVYRKNKPRITVAQNADSIRSEFWNNNSLREISPREEAIYRRIDSLVTLDTNKIIQKEKGNYGLSLEPYLNYNRVEDLSLGISPELSMYDFATLFGRGYFSFGQKKPYGELGIKFKLIEDKSLNLVVGTKMFSEIISQSNDKSFSKFENTLLSAIYSSDYYDYVRKDGYEIFMNSKYKNLKLDVFYTMRHNSGVEKRSDTLLNLFEELTHWTDNQVRPNRDWDLLRATINYTEKDFLGFDGFNFSSNLVLSLGSNGDKGQYSAYDAAFRLDIPTFKTGYGFSELTLLTEFGHVTDNAPLPHTFRMKTRNIMFTPFGNFANAPIGYYGGNLYQTLHARWNTSDLLWRAIGLPTYKGRGIELIFGYAAANYKTNVNFMKTMGDKIFQEASIGFGRVPSFVSDVAFFDFIFSRGIGDLASKRLRISVGMNVGFKLN